MQDEFPERERHHWWKAKKWAYFNLNRLYIRYAKSEHRSLVIGYDAQVDVRSKCWSTDMAADTVTPKPSTRPMLLRHSLLQTSRRRSRQKS